MKTTTTKRRGLPATEEDAILRGAERVVGDPTLVRVECLFYTRRLLRKAGFLSPTPFHRYLVKIEEKGGRLCVCR
jgi:ABC-type glycerol-3-phosphate transport system substrate-binding protein